MALDFPAIDPVAISLGPLVVRWYALAYLAGILGAWKYINYLIDRHKEFARPNKPDIENFLAWAILGIILGGRLGYVLFYKLAYYVQNLNEVFYVWQGGMAFHGGVLGVILVMILFSYKHKIDQFRLADLVCCAVPIGLFFGRIANFINGELYGRPSDVPWAVRFPSDSLVPRHPSQLYEAFLEGLVLFTVLFIAQKQDNIRAKTGLLSAIFLIGYAASRILIELVREPDDHLGFIFGGISMGQILSVPMVLFALWLIYRVSRNHSPQ